jgi:hypothetical protein
VRVVLDAPDEAGADGLALDVAVGAAELGFVAQAAVEVVFLPFESPEPKMAHGEGVVDELGRRAVDSLHHVPEVFADGEAADDVVVIREQTDDPGLESIFVGPMGEAVPEDLLCALFTEMVQAVSYFGRDEVDGVVAVQCSKR